jgi:hypothetical protein
MSKKIEDLAFKYNINATVDELSLFVSEVYNDGYHDGKAFKDRHITIRDHFAGLAMQGYLSGYYAGGDSHKAIAEESYELADAMLKAREINDE